MIHSPPWSSCPLQPTTDWPAPQRVQLGLPGHVFGIAGTSHDNAPSSLSKDADGERRATKQANARSQALQELIQSAHTSPVGRSPRKLPRNNDDDVSER